MLLPQNDAVKFFFFHPPPPPPTLWKIRPIQCVQHPPPVFEVRRWYQHLPFRWWYEASLFFYLEGEAENDKITNVRRPAWRWSNNINREKKLQAHHPYDVKWFRCITRRVYSERSLRDADICTVEASPLVLNWTSFLLYTHNVIVNDFTLHKSICHAWKSGGHTFSFLDRIKCSKTDRRLG